MPLGPASHSFRHGNLHLWNLPFADDLAGAIDFTDCGWGPCAWSPQFLRAAQQVFERFLGG